VDEPDAEYAKRIRCEANQLHIYSAVLKYHNEHKEVPSNMAILVEQGYISQEDIHCPAQKTAQENVYKYFPENFGKTDLPIISESAENHPAIRKWFRKLNPVINEIMGNGSPSVVAKI
jgi:hypothetical protein